MKKLIVFMMMLIAFNLFSDTITQVVVVTFENDNFGNVNELNISGPSVLLKINKSEIKDNIYVVENDTTNLSWYTNQNRKKITLSSSLPNSNMKLYAKAINVAGGLSTGNILVSGYQKDIVTDIDKSDGICNILFKAKADKKSFGSKDVHILTYTLTDF